MQKYKVSVSDYDIMPKFTAELCKEGIEFNTSTKSDSENGLFINVDYDDTSRFEILCANKGITVSKI